MTSDADPDPSRSSGTVSNRRRVLEHAVSHGLAEVKATLKRALTSRGLSYDKVKSEIGLSKGTLSGWMNGTSRPQKGMRREFMGLVKLLGLVDPPHTPGGAMPADWWDAIQTAPLVPPQPEPDPEPERAPGPSPSPGRTPQRDGIPPYPGMRPFGLDNAHRFPGRTRTVEELRGQLCLRLDGRRSPLLLVTGRSGVGKSSLVATAVARLEACARRRILSPGTEALAALRTFEDDAPQVLVLDHAETLWTTCDPDVAFEMLELLALIDQQPRRSALVLVLRADAIAPATDVDVLARAIERASIVVRPITRGEAREIILEPTAAAGITLEDGLVDLILRDADPGIDGAPEESLGSVLPLLSQTMRTLWEVRTAQDRITATDYLHTGGVAKSIENAAEAAFASLSPEAQTASWPVLREMIRLVGPTPVRQPAPWTAFVDDPSHEVVQTFLHAHLLTADHEQVTIGHDLLLRTWPRLSEWLARARDLNDAQRLLVRYANFWDESGRPDELLLTHEVGTILEAQERDDGSSATYPLRRVEAEFLEAGRSAQQAARRKDREATEAENRRLQRERNRFRRTAVLAVVFLVLALVLAGWAGITALQEHAGQQVGHAGGASSEQAASALRPEAGAPLGVTDAQDLPEAAG